MARPDVGSERLIGYGRIARVTLARDTRLGRLVAVKRLTPHDGVATEAVEDLLSRVAAHSAHPAVVTIHHHGVDDDGTPWLVTDVGAGGDLQTRLEDGTRWTTLEALLLCHRLAEGAAVLHEAGLVHGDIRPANVLLDQCDDPALGDAGLEPLWREATDVELTNAPLGVMALIAPEVLGGEAPTPEADTFAIGGTLHVLLTGRPPYVDGDRGRVGALQRMLDGDLADLRPRGLPHAVWELLFDALDPDPAGRPAPGQALAAQLRRVATAVVEHAVSWPPTVEGWAVAVDGRHPPQGALAGPPPHTYPPVTPPRGAPGSW